KRCVSALLQSAALHFADQICLQRDQFRFLLLPTRAAASASAPSAVSAGCSRPVDWFAHTIRARSLATDRVQVGSPLAQSRHVSDNHPTAVVHDKTNLLSPSS